MKNRFFQLMLCLMLVLSLAVPAAMAEMPADGTYTGTGVGMHSNIEVSVTVADGKITAVEVLSQDETPVISDPAFEKLPGMIVEANSADIEGVAGATLSSNGIKEAVANALAGNASGNTEVTIVPDMIVIGGGFGGTASALRGAQLGLNVLLIEESPRMGGCMFFAGGTISGAGYQLQKEAGVEDTPEAFFADIVALGGEGEYNTELSQMHTERAKDAIDWLDKELGVDFADRSLVAGAYTAMPTPRVTRALGLYSMGAAQEYMGKLFAALDEYINNGQVQVLLNTTVTEILVDGDTCLGVKTADAEYLAPSVVLATGGYCYNEDLLKLSGFENVISSAPSTSNGSGFLMAKALGGVYDNMDEIVNFYGGGIPSDGFQMSLQLTSGYRGLVYVDANGNRVGAEDKPTSAMWFGVPESKLYGIVSADTINPDAALIRRPMGNTNALSNNGWDMLEELAAAGNCVYKADTLEELAEKIGAANLTATIAAYNADAAAGTDTAFGRNADNLVALENGPFYAIMTVPYVWSGSSGGVRANADGYLWREDGSVITGLSLAGEILGPSNILGKINFGGINHAMCATWGMIAAEHAAAMKAE